MTHNCKEYFLGKTDTSGRIATNKSEDVTEQVKAIMMMHMDGICKDNNATIGHWRSSTILSI